MNASAQQNQQGDLMDLVISGLGWVSIRGEQVRKSSFCNRRIFIFYRSIIEESSFSIEESSFVHITQPATLTVSAPLGTAELQYKCQLFWNVPLKMQR